MKITFEYFVEITDISESNSNGKIGNIVGAGVLMLNQFSCMENTVFQQIFKRRLSENALEATAAFALTDMNGTCNVI